MDLVGIEHVVLEAVSTARSLGFYFFFFFFKKI
jgi:hypothetical protein